MKLSRSLAFRVRKTISPFKLYHMYHNTRYFLLNKSGTEDNPIKIAGYQEEQPVWDGTVTIQPSQWNFDEDTRICSAQIDQDIIALFYQGNLMTAARWPNSKWSDKSCFDHQYWRPCPNSERGTIVDEGLADANLDFTGAMAILNIGSWTTFVRMILDVHMSNFSQHFSQIHRWQRCYHMREGPTISPMMTILLSKSMGITCNITWRQVLPSWMPRKSGFMIKTQENKFLQKMMVKIWV